MNRPVTAFALVVALMALGACGSSKLEPLAPGDRILAFGDSLTAGIGAATQHSYPTVLAQLSGLDVVNAGVSGETTADGMQRLPGELERVSPALLVLTEGGNDILRNVSSRVIKENLRAMIEYANSRGVPVVLIGVPQKNLFSSVAPLYRELAEEYALVFDDALLSDLLRAPRYKSDMVHFNERGYRAMAEAIYALLDDNGAIP